MNKKIFISLILLFVTLFELIPVRANEEPLLVDAVIFADDTFFTSIESAESFLISNFSDSIQIERRFTHALFGFHARLPLDIIDDINQSGIFTANVLGSFKILEASTAEYSEASLYATEMLGIQNTETAKYTGKGTVVAVIDSGFDITHEVFTNMPTSGKLTKEKVAELMNNEELYASSSASQVEPFVSEKLPFVFDYTTFTNNVSTVNSHGTHVAAIIGGKSDVMTGVAPDCQLLLMKVFDSNSEYASEATIIYALEDAMALNVDVINLSLGTYSGFSYTGTATAFNKIADKLKQNGITVVCAAGNSGTIGNQSYYADTYGIIYPMAKMSDFGTLNSPASIESFIAVASAQNTRKYYDTLVHVENDGSLTRIEYSDTCAQFDIIKTTFTTYFDSKELEYVCVPGLGEASDYKKLDVYGKIALIERGTIPFSEKIKNAANAGAIAAVIYNNVDEDEDVYMDMSGCNIPAVFISASDGKLLRNANNKKLSFDKVLRTFAENPNAGAISSFSSRGPTPEMLLKPDITAIGESVYSAAAGGTYTALSGTSMATPFVSGAAAALCQMLNESDNEIELAKRSDYIRALLMNSAAPIIDKASENEYSPRSQGAGLLNLDNALNSALIITSFGETRIELIGKKNYYEFEADIRNLADEKTDVELDVKFLRDIALEFSTKEGKTLYFNSLHSDKLEFKELNAESDNASIEKSQSGYKLTLEANEEATVFFEVTFDDQMLFEGTEFKNGFFIDGYLYARTDDSVSSIALSGFCGDISDSAIFDASIYEDNTPFFSGNMLMSKNIDDEFEVLPNTDRISRANELASFSPNNDEKFDLLYLSLSLLRNIKDYKYEILDENGNILYTENSGSALTKSGQNEDQTIWIWDAGDAVNDEFVFPDGSYVLKFTGFSAIENDEQTISLPFAIDTSAPKLDYSYLSVKDGKTILTIETLDNIGVKTAEVYTDGTIPKSERNIYTDVYDGDNSFEFDITGLTGDYIWADLTDFAMNTRTVRIISPAYNTTAQSGN